MTTHTLSTSDAALIAQFGLPANSTPDEIDDAIMSKLTAKYGLPADATVEAVEAEMHRVRCCRFGLDPATTSEKALDAHVDALIRARKQAA